MDKETAKKILNEIIDSQDEIRDFTISADIEEIDRSTLEGGYKEFKYTGITNIYITTYKEPK